MDSSPGMLSSLAARAIFLPSLAYNIVMEKISAREWYNHIDEHVILGALPLRSMADELVKEQNVKAIVSLNEDYELRYLARQPWEWNELGVNAIHFSVTDMFEAPSQEMLAQGVAFIEENIALFSGKGGKIYVHCKAGRSRSATMVGCYLMKKYKFNPEEAVEYMKSKRSHVLLHPQKMEALVKFHQIHVADQ